MSHAYVPSALEKKKIILSYMLLGLLAYMEKKEFSPYESYHIKVAAGWRIVFLLLGGVVLLPFILIPGFRILGLLLYVGLFVLWCLGVYQAWSNVYKPVEERHLLSFLYALGGWFFAIFEIDVDSSAVRRQMDKSDSSFSDGVGEAISTDSHSE